MQFSVAFQQINIFVSMFLISLTLWTPKSMFPAICRWKYLVLLYALKAGFLMCRSGLYVRLVFEVFHLFVAVSCMCA